MAQVPYTSLYQGPFAVYTSATGMSSQVTGTPYLGGSLHEGDYCDLQAKEAAVWNEQFGSSLNAGRYRFVRLSTLATAANIGFGVPLGWGAPTSSIPISPNFVSSLDASAISETDVRAIALIPVTAAQITAGAWIVVQELGIAPLLVTTATSTVAGSQANAAANGVVTTTAAGAQSNAGFIGQILETAAAATVTLVDLALPVRQG